jgi:transposase
MKKWKFSIGVDVSKLTLDICCSECGQHVQISNDAKGFKAFEKWCKAIGIQLTESIVVMEHTGGYEYKFIQFCESKSISYCRVPGLEIKKSLGITRGKNDKVDSMRIAEYAEEKQKKLTPSAPLNKNILQLRQLLSFRKRLVRESAGLTSTRSERKHMYGNKKDIILIAIDEKIEANKGYLKQIEKEIEALINNDVEMKRNYDIITSIKGIAMVNGSMTIAYTENFTSFVDPRKYAVYVGVAPFEHSSGTSIKGKKRTSNIANKELKQELNQAARSAIAYDPEIRAYAIRKMESKVYGIVLNNVKFKLILRMFALVKRGEMFVENYKKAA